MNLAGYVRVSRVGGREGEGYISPSVQRESIEQLATEIGGTIGEWFVDEDFSGGTTKRPDFQQALDRIQAGEFDGIAVMKIDRFARSVADGTTIVRELTESGKTFVSVHERIDPTTPEGKYMLTSFLAQGELFLDQMKASWNVAKNRATERGVAIVRTPFGYLRVKATPTKPHHISTVQAAELMGVEVPVSTLIPDPDTAHFVTEAFKRSAGGDPPGEIAAWLQIQSPKDTQRGWAAHLVRRLLANRLYLGEVNYLGIRTVDAHMPLTDPRTFEQAQQPTTRRARRKGSKRPFTGLPRCAHCESPMVSSDFGAARGETPVYRCGMKSGAGCGNGSVITAAKLEPFIYGLAREGLKQALAGRNAAGVDDEIGEIEDKIREAEAEFDSYITNLTVRRTLGEQQWEAGMQARAQAVEALNRQRKAAIEADRLHQINVEDPSDHDLSRFAFGAIDHIIVHRGRGTVTERCEVIWRQDDHGNA